MLQALPHTALWLRLEREGRLMNVVPTRPVEDIAQEYVEAFGQLYEPHNYLNRVHRYFLKLGPARVKSAFKFPDPMVIRA